MVIAISKYVIYAPGKCVPKGRPRFVQNKYTGTPSVYTPKKTQDYEKYIKECTRAVIKNPIEGYFSVKIFVSNSIPKSWTKKKKEDAKSGLIKPTVGDLDNMVKSVLDGMNGVAFKDDKFMYKLEAEKKYSDNDTVIVVIEY